jgi:hypothetical protein
MNRLKIITPLAAGLLGALGGARAQPPPEAEAVSQFRETFSGPALDERLWSITRKNDFQESTIDLVDGRLRLRAATIGTKDDTVKYHGVRTVRPLRLRPPVEVSFVLDWNDQKNGCYLTAGVLLCPTATDGNPEDEKDWFKFEYVGVPPGQNARAWVSVRTNGGERVVYDEGWPEKQRTGRKIGRQTVQIRWQDHRLALRENGRVLWEGEGVEFPPQAYLYLQMSSHSNYPAREVFFDDVRVEALDAGR